VFHWLSGQLPVKDDRWFKSRALTLKKDDDGSTLLLHPCLLTASAVLSSSPICPLKSSEPEFLI